MLMTILGFISVFLVSVEQGDIDRSLAARDKGPDAASFCESDGTPIAFALHRLGYELNAQDDDWVLVARTWSHEPVKYRLTWVSLDRTGRVCRDAERIGPFTAVLVAGEYTEEEERYQAEVKLRALARVP